MSKRETPLGAGPSPGRIAVRRLTRAVEVATSQIVHAVRAAAGNTPIRSISVALVDDTAMTTLHLQFMGQTGPTDVLTFDLRDRADQHDLEGEIVVSADTARRQARQYQTRPSDELLRYVIHGVLHLLGYDDDSPAHRRRMRRAENRVLASLKPQSRRPRRQRSSHHG